MQRRWFLPTLAGVFCVVPGHATQYLDVSAAQKLCFPSADRFESAHLKISNEQKEKVTEISGVKMRNSELKVWKAYKGKALLGYFIVDEVYGKHEFITYGVGISATGAVTGVEIMDYRETYGYQIREEGWRKQFFGKTIQDPLKMDKDIMNISGATLSCRHVTDGVKRLLALVKVSLKT